MRRALLAVTLPIAALVVLSAARQNPADAAPAPIPKAAETHLVDVLRGMIGRPCSFAARDGACGLVVYDAGSDDVDTKLTEVGADYVVIQSEDETRWVPIAAQNFIVHWK